jgi:hypothetical protein
MDNIFWGSAPKNEKQMGYAIVVGVLHQQRILEARLRKERNTIGINEV